MKRNIEKMWRALMTRAKARPNKAARGMTLVEIMVVVIIIGLVASVVGVAVFNELDKAKKKTTMIQMKKLEEALALYKLSYHQYPSTGEGLRALSTSKGGDKPVMENVPRDAWDQEYVYIYPGSNRSGSFDIMSYGADGVAGGGDDITNWQAAADGQGTN